jgi:hypothetical protein
MQYLWSDVSQGENKKHSALDGLPYIPAVLFILEGTLNPDRRTRIQTEVW